MDRHGITYDILGSALAPLVVEARNYFLNPIYRHDFLNKSKFKKC